MFKNILKSVEGTDTFSIIAMIVFFLFFIYIIYRTFYMDKKVVDKMSHLPLEDDAEDSKTNKE